MIDVNTHCKLWQDLTIENVLSSAWGRKPIKNQGKNIKIQCPINCKNIVDSSIHFTVLWQDTGKRSKWITAVLQHRKTTAVLVQKHM